MEFNEKSHVIKSNRLKVELLYPGEYYRGVRFDWTGIISQVYLDDKYKFCTKEPTQNGTTTNGWGLCNQFMNFVDLEADKEPAIAFPRIGIGLAKSLKIQKFDVFNPYEIKPYQFEITKEENSICYYVKPLICRGIAAELYKKIVVNKNTLEINYSLVNVGEETIDTSEYNHNFIKIDNIDIGENYKLTMPYSIKKDNAPEILKIIDNVITFKEKPKKSFYYKIDISDEKSPHFWKLECYKDNKILSIEEKDSMPAYDVAIWGTKDVISPEIFLKIKLHPNNKLEWSRKYIFDYKEL